MKHTLMGDGRKISEIDSFTIEPTYPDTIKFSFTLVAPNSDIAAQIHKYMKTTNSFVITLDHGELMVDAKVVK